MPIHLIKHPQIRIFLELFKKWNRKINLVSFESDEELLTKHVIDSLFITKFLDFKEFKKVLDLGTGGGFPGMILALVYPLIHFTLVDSAQKKIAVLNKIIEQIRIKNVFAIAARAEELSRDSKLRESFDLVVSRAVAPLPVLLEYAIPFTKVGGLFVAYKGPGYGRELRKSEKAIEELGIKLERLENYELPQNQGLRTFLIFRKIKKTPEIYPRRTGIPRKRPL